MIIKAFDVDSIEMTRYDPKLNMLFLRFAISDGSTLEGEFVFGNDLFSLIENIVKWVKHSVKLEEDSDRFLTGVCVKSLRNDEHLRENLYKALVRFDSKLKMMKSGVDARVLLNRYGSFQVMKEVLYTKK